MANYTVAKNRLGGWNIKRDASKRISIRLDTQRLAENTAKKYAANSGGGEVRIKSLNGRFRDSDTIPPARDTFSPKDIKH